jgi:hypothetical protein
MLDWRGVGVFVHDWIIEILSAGSSRIVGDQDCNPRKMAYLSGVVMRVLAFLACFLATLLLGFAELRLHPTDPCEEADSCCCSEPATVDPCVCGEELGSDFPEIAAGGLSHLAAPPAGALGIGELAPLAELAPRWHPALPWHAPPEERRARLAVWIL